MWLQTLKQTYNNNYKRTVLTENRDKQIQGNKNNEQGLHIQKYRYMWLVVVGVQYDVTKSLKLTLSGWRCS